MVSGGCGSRGPSSSRPLGGSGGAFPGTGGAGAGTGAGTGGGLGGLSAGADSTGGKGSDTVATSTGGVAGIATGGAAALGGATGAPGGGGGGALGPAGGSAGLTFVELPFVEDTYAFSGSFASIELADINGDGKLDLVMGQLPTGDSNAVVSLGNGDGTFASPRPIPSVAVPSLLMIGDLDGDRRPDLLFSPGQAGPGVPPPADTSLRLSLNGGDGTYGEAIATGILSGRRGFDATTTTLGDLNGDLLTDIAVLNSYEVEVALNSGHGTFAPVGRYPHNLDVLAALPPSPHPRLGRAIAMGDLNGDLRPDLAVALESHFVSLLLNHGDGTFAPPIFLSIAQVPDTIVITDVSGDGRADLIVAGEPGTGPPPSTLNVFVNLGGGTFSPPVVYPYSSGSYIGIQAVDLNSDGRVDLFTSNMEVRLNQGDGTLAPPFPLPVAAGGPITFGDVNRDGKVDVAVGVNRDVHVFLNTSR